MSELKNKIVWITGASSGIGEATAYVMAKEGSKLVLSARRKDELEKVKQNCGLPDGDVLVLPLDVEDFEKIKEATQSVIAKFGKIDLLFNNAGISQRGDVLTTSMEVYQRIININFLGVIALTKAVLPYMINQNSGHIVVTSSVSGKLGTPLRSGYSATKHALHGFFDSLRAEVYRNNIQVTLVCPGYINTNISLNALSSDGSKHGKMDTNQQNGVPADICAQKIVAGIRNNKSEIYIGGKEVLGVYLKRFFPKILEKIVLKQAPK
ncbi:SDR family oxidoreductase [Lacihabitans sp. LS3-19]|uniref:SDR family oxidoreductase n=1 Tax=Lacihabitans sp. LS3-19 TaxID=2487335 RepID=UPI0020CE548A|nr:SDR family oxidoreductase [Lacihabitans sp. LS3-19]MCP9769545.1 SDR family oxidoreductase [Lacihabitans sp. LS3-19]